MEISAAVEGVGALMFARGRSTEAGYDGGLNNPFGFFSFVEGVGAMGVSGAEGI